ncbi:MAG: peptidoglycan-binding domain-containing protein [Candidatus Paceibacterota bacterium]
MKKFLTRFVFSLFAALFLVLSPVYALTPSLSVSSTGSGDSVRITVNGDASSTVILSYTKTGTGLQLSSLGTTDSTGYFSTTISSGTYGVAASSAVYVLVNGQQSSSVAWPQTVTSSSLNLSQTGVVLSVGQSSTVTAGSSSLYLSNNSNPPIANVNISGSSITITANSYGSTVVSVCSQGSTTNCGSIYVTVQNSGYSALTFSQTSVTIAAGQTVPVSISGGNGSYTILNNSNPGVIQASINNSILNLSTLSSSGSSSITICSSGQSYCGIVNVTIGSASYTTLTFNPSNPSVAIGQTTTVNISGGASSTYYISANSNPSYVQATVNGSTLSLYGISSGVSVVTICSSVGNCSSLSITVNYVSSGGNITLSQSSLSLLTGQALSVTISGGASPYSLASYPASIFSANISGNIVTITGVSSGTGTIAVCSAEGGCTNLSVTVNGSGSSSNSSIVLSQSSVSLALGQSSSVYITGSGSYYVSSNSNPGVVSVSINGNTISISATTIGNANIYVCQTGGQCATLIVNVSASGSSSTSASSFLVASQGTVSLSSGQSATIQLSGGSNNSYSVAYNSSSSTVSTSISGSSMTVNGINNGTAVIVVCSVNNSCVPISVSVGSSTSASTIILSPSSISLKSGTGSIITIMGGSSYYLSKNSNPNVVSIAIVGNKAIVAGLSTGTADLTICQTSGQCATLGITVTSGTSPNSSTTSSKYKFKGLLYIGITSDEVLELQKRLAAEGYFSGPATGKFGGLTYSAVIEYQKAHGIRQTGNVGEVTRAALNEE